MSSALLLLLLVSGVKSQSCPSSPNLSGDGEPFRQPCEWRSEGGRLQGTLTLGPFFYDDWATAPFETRTFEGSIPGPTLRLKPGDTLELTLQNDLQWGESVKYSWDCATPHCLHTQFRDPSVTNLHDCRSTDCIVLVEVNPQSSHRHTIEIPDEHSPGTYWYHPHHHGSTSLQVGGGAAGAIVIEDREGDLPPSIANLEERVLVFQEISVLEEPECERSTLAPTGVLGVLGGPFLLGALLWMSAQSCARMRNPVGGQSTNIRAARSVDPYRASVCVAFLSDDSILPRTDIGGFMRSFTLVNGLYRPLIDMETGRWYRFRMIWASLAQTFWVRFGGCEVRLLALDGVYLRDAPNRRAPPDPSSGEQA
uniref:Plastocyanin-like domain-containing protein n=1 Tax=Chromera velia CCMP2878 TaxID=1169474 RepID=A0A0G4FYV0_9ALVE|eukprot:Cvel_19369.t1-p1 / transcript=Cvel_19369.t1 / gene=Cvel_19369 / organism=Chromera_velia_CCMP2878 / gene_product=hypothetical protein / transcript_product=hypothetical protein / location=Cvel_scaffold1664:38129-41247(+) / protein_length=365 / sequence_SO=supercontig / SO=protein_coding / is_pseudo=false